MFKNIKYLSTILVSALFLFTACDDSKKQKELEVKKEIEKVKVKVHTIKKQNYPIWVDFTGKTEAFKSVDLSSKANGELKQIDFKAGQIVKKNQLLFILDDKEYKAKLEEKKASLQKDKASLNLAISQVKRYKPLVQKGLAPKEKLDELLANQKQLQAVVNSHMASVKQAELDLEDTKIKATIDGKIGKSLIDIGNIVNVGDKLANIVQSKKLFVNFNPSSRDVFLINQYKSEKYPKVKVLPESIDNMDLSLDGKVDFIDSVTDETTGTVLMRAVIDNKKDLLFPGTFVNIKLFITDKYPLIAVHPNNLSQNQLGSYVFVVDKNNKIKKVQVEVQYSNNDIAIIKEGLQNEDKVVVGQTAHLKELQEVEFIEVSNPVVIK